MILAKPEFCKPRGCFCNTVKPALRELECLLLQDIYMPCFTFLPLHSLYIKLQVVQSFVCDLGGYFSKERLTLFVLARVDVLILNILM